MSWLLSLLADLLGIFLRNRESTAEKLGQAETKAQDAQADVSVLHKELEAAADAPVTNKAMSDLLNNGKLAWLFFALFCTSCVSDHGIAYPCPALRHWSVVDQQNAAADLEALPQDSPVWGMMRDYATMREQGRACEGE